MGVSPQSGCHRGGAVRDARRPGDGCLGQLGHQHRLLLGPAQDLAVAARASWCARSTGRSPSRPTARSTTCRCRCPRPARTAASPTWFRTSCSTAAAPRPTWTTACCCTTSCSSTRPRQGIGCPISEPFFGAGNERTHLHLPTPFGYTNNAANWNMITHLVNKSATARTVNVEIIFRWRPLSETGDARPLWLDIDSICSGGDSEYTIPTGYSDTHVDWTVAAGRPHHRHVRATCTTSTSSTRARARCTARSAAGRSRSRPSWWAAPAATTTGRSRPTTRRRPTSPGRRCADRRPTTGPRSAPRNGTQRPPRYDEPVRDLQRPARGQQAEAYPASGAYPSDGLSDHDRPGDQAAQRVPERLRRPKTDVMGIMHAWLAFADTRLPAPEGRDADARIAGARLQRSARASNRTHGPPLGRIRAPATRRRQNSGQLTVGTPDANGAGREHRGLGEGRRAPGQRRHAGRRGRRADHVSIADVRRKSDLRRLHGPAAGRDRAADHRPLQRPLARSAPGRTPVSRSRCRAPPPATRRSARPARSRRPPTRSRPAPSRRAGARSGSSARCASTTAAPTEWSSTTPQHAVRRPGRVVP